MLSTILRRRSSCYSYFVWLCVFFFFLLRSVFMLSLVWLFVLVLLLLFFREEKAGLCGSRAFVCCCCFVVVVVFVLLFSHASFSFFFFFLFLFLFVSGFSCGIWLWHSMDFSVDFLSPETGVTPLILALRTAFFLKNAPLYIMPEIRYPFLPKSIRLSAQHTVA